MTTASWSGITSANWCIFSDTPRRRRRSRRPRRTWAALKCSSCRHTGLLLIGIFVLDQEGARDQWAVTTGRCGSGVAVVGGCCPSTGGALSGHRRGSGRAMDEVWVSSEGSVLPERGVSWPLDAPPKLGLGHGSRRGSVRDPSSVGTSSSLSLGSPLSRCSQD